MNLLARSIRRRTRYRYDPFGIILESSGPMAEMFRFRFSTKYHEPVSGLVLYQKRAYCPELGRWLSRDPIGEDGGLNLYAFCGNNPVDRFDKLGEAYFAVRSLEGFKILSKFPKSSRGDTNNLEFVHEHLFFEDGDNPSNLGFFNDGRVRPDQGSFRYRTTLTGYKDCVMRLAVKATPPMPYSLIRYNCQDWAESVRKTYERFINSPGIRKRCCIKDSVLFGW